MDQVQVAAAAAALVTATDLTTIQGSFSNYAGAATARTAPPYGPSKRGMADPVRLHDLLEAQMKRIAQSLHDGAGQLLAAVHLKLAEVGTRLPEEHRGRIGDLELLLDRMEDELRRISHELRPLILDDLGLMPAVNFLRYGVAQRTGLRIAVAGTIPGRLPSTIESAVYRIVHETLMDIAKHSSAKRVWIAFRKDDRIHCSIRTDGAVESIEACAEETSFSLAPAAIRERVEDLSGTLSACSTPDGGTELLISIPLY